MHVQHRKRAVILTAFLFFTISSEIYPGFLSFNERCLWVVRSTMQKRESIDQMIEFAKNNGFNHILVQVRGRGDALYNSKLVPRSELLEDTVFDPLYYVIRKAHQNGLKVHAWMNVYLIWSKTILPNSQNHVLNSHPEWIDKNGNEFTSLFKTDNKIDGEGYYLAPHHPEVKKHLLSVFREISALYDIDGLHLDYIRFHDNEYGNNSEAKATYYQKLYHNRKPLFNNNDVGTNREWDNFRKASITELLNDTKQMLKEVRPDCILSAAVKPNVLDAKNRYFQEWDYWLAAGYLDWVIPMNYTPDLREFADNINLIYENLPKKYRNRIIMGIALYNQPPLDAVDKIYYSEITRFKGISFFSYNVIATQPTYFKTLKHSQKY
ncbi:MAG: glycoside hydrolase family 10 protein [Fidelibacterota bacterium]